MKKPKNDWVLFCKRTDDPKLSWIEKQLDLQGIEHKREGRSFHADHILYVREKDEIRAGELLMTPAPPRLRRWYKTIDDIPDDHQMFQTADVIDPEELPDNPPPEWR